MKCKLCGYTESVKNDEGYLVCVLCGTVQVGIQETQRAVDDIVAQYSSSATPGLIRSQTVGANTRKRRADCIRQTIEKSLKNLDLCKVGKRDLLILFYLQNKIKSYFSSGQLKILGLAKTAVQLEKRTKELWLGILTAVNKRKLKLITDDTISAYKLLLNETINYATYNVLPCCDFKSRQLKDFMYSNHQDFLYTICTDLQKERVDEINCNIQKSTVLKESFSNVSTCNKHDSMAEDCNQPSKVKNHSSVTNSLILDLLDSNFMDDIVEEELGAREASAEDHYKEYSGSKQYNRYQFFVIPTVRVANSLKCVNIDATYFEQFTDIPMRTHTAIVSNTAYGKKVTYCITYYFYLVLEKFILSSTDAIDSLINPNEISPFKRDEVLSFFESPVDNINARSTYFKDLVFYCFGNKIFQNCYNVLYKPTAITLSSSLPPAIIIFASIIEKIPLIAADLNRYYCKNRWCLVKSEEDSSLPSLVQNKALKLDSAYKVGANFIYESILSMHRILSDNAATAETFSFKNQFTYIKRVLYRSIVLVHLPCELYPVVVCLLKFVLEKDSTLKSKLDKTAHFNYFSVLAAVILASARLCFCQLRHTTKCQYTDQKSSINSHWVDELAKLCINYENIICDLESDANSYFAFYDHATCPLLFGTNNLFKSYITNSSKNDFVMTDIDPSECSCDESSSTNTVLLSDKDEKSFTSLKLGECCDRQNHKNSLYTTNSQECSAERSFISVPPTLNSGNKEGFTTILNFHPAVMVIMHRLATFYAVHCSSICRDLYIIETSVYNNLIC